ncbi:MAG: hypothetical protein D6791_15885 [Chloroflexi bacterium]|nr:MAG: hypothetical protein D6791_15885 [Chloroflexota bacterium]
MLPGFSSTSTSRPSFSASEPLPMPTRVLHLSQRYIFRFWLPLAVMWLMMAVEQPILSAVIARLQEPKLNLAAFGVTFSLALLIESPIIMLLVAGTALARGRQSYRQLLRFTAALSGAITVVHLLVALTPLFGILVGRLVGAPEELVEPARFAFLLMFPWSAAVAFRRLWQGIMIRFGKTDQVGVTTIVRLIATATVAFAGLAFGVLPGAALAGVALSVGTIAGAAAAYYWTRPILRGPLARLEAEKDRISLRALIDFYVPLALTNVINFLGRPLLTLALSRAILPLESLALWPVLLSLAFLFRSIGFAYQEVVVALLDKQESHLALRRFAFTMAFVTTVLLFLLAITPLNDFWYGRVSGLSRDLVELSRLSTLLIALAPASAFLISWQRGILVTVRRTRPITLAVAINVSVMALSIWLGIRWLAVPGIYLAAAAFMLALLAETIFLSWQARLAARRITSLSITPA